MWVYVNPARQILREQGNSGYWLKCGQNISYWAVHVKRDLVCSLVSSLGGELETSCRASSKIALSGFPALIFIAKLFWLTKQKEPQEIVTFSLWKRKTKFGSPTFLRNQKKVRFRYMLVSQFAVCPLWPQYGWNGGLPLGESYSPCQLSKQWKFPGFFAAVFQS